MYLIPNSSIIKINFEEARSWQISLKSQLEECKGNDVVIICLDLLLTCKDIKLISRYCEKNDSKIILIESNIAETIVSSKSLGYNAKIHEKYTINENNSIKKTQERNLSINKQFSFHQGTLHSGEILESESSLLVLGDINPGAHIKSNGDLIVWGRLLGTAHAGKEGNLNASISALQLHPVQLRIGSIIARGPEEKSQTGTAERAEVKSGIIVISPAKIFKA